MTVRWNRYYLGVLYNSGRKGQGFTRLPLVKLVVRVTSRDLSQLGTSSNSSGYRTLPRVSERLKSFSKSQEIEGERLGRRLVRTFPLYRSNTGCRTLDRAPAGIKFWVRRVIHSIDLCVILEPSLGVRGTRSHRSRDFVSERNLLEI